MPTPRDVAQWMLAELGRQRFLYQDAVAGDIAARFGDDFVYVNVLGNLAISREVLAEFRSLTENSVVWERGERLWRFREETDPPTRRVD